MKSFLQLVLAFSSIVVFPTQSVAENLSSNEPTITSLRDNGLVEHLRLSNDQILALQPILHESRQSRLSVFNKYGLDETPARKPSSKELRKLKGDLAKIQSLTVKRIAEILDEKQLESYLAIQKAAQKRFKERRLFTR